MDWKQLQESIDAKSIRERIDRFKVLDRWFAENPDKKTVITVDGPSGSPTTPIDRSDAINERQALAFQIARDAVDWWHQFPKG